MKRLFLVIVIAAVLLWFIRSKPDTQQNQAINFSSPTPTSGASFSSFTVNDPRAVVLIPNFASQKTSATAARENTCRMLTSAGFYLSQTKPIGLFVAQGKQLSPYQPNALFNGFFSIDTKGNAIIGSDVPDTSSRLALQSGPLLIADGVWRKLSIRDDRPARRIVVAQTTDALLFLVLYESENVFEGPKLAHVPKRLKEIEQELGVAFINALNLDGGSASAFITKDVSLTELTPVGSFFCAQ